MPDDAVKGRWDLDAPGLGTVRMIGLACGVSVDVAALRVKMTDAPRAVAVSRAGIVEWWAETAAFGARVRAARAVPPESEAAKLHAASGDAPAHEGVAISWDVARVTSRAVRSGDVVVSWLATTGRASTLG